MKNVPLFAGLLCLAGMFIVVSVVLEEPRLTREEANTICDLVRLVNQSDAYALEAAAATNTSVSEAIDIMEPRYGAAPQLRAENNDAIDRHFRASIAHEQSSAAWSKICKRKMR